MRIWSHIIMVISLLLLPCISVEAVDDTVRYKIAEDILSRLEPDSFLLKEKESNIQRLLKDCDFEAVDLSDDGEKEIIVRVDWRSNGTDGFSKGFSHVRGVHGQGIWQIYKINKESVVHLGTMNDGNFFKLLSRNSSGYKTIETWAHDSYNTSLIDTYSFSKGQYYMISSVLYELNEDGTKKKKIKTYK